MSEQDSTARRIRRYVQLLCVMDGPHWHGLVTPEDGDILHLSNLASSLEAPESAKPIESIGVEVLERHARSLRTRNDELARSIVAPAYEREKARLALRLAMDLEDAVKELRRFGSATPRPTEAGWRDLRSRAG